MLDIICWEDLRTKVDKAPESAPATRTKKSRDADVLKIKNWFDFSCCLLPPFFFRFLYVEQVNEFTSFKFSEVKKKRIHPLFKWEWMNA